MFTKLIIHEDLPFNLGESTYFHDFMLEVSKGSYKRACDQTLGGLVSVLSDFSASVKTNTSPHRGNMRDSFLAIKALAVRFRILR